MGRRLSGYGARRAAEVMKVVQRKTGWVTASAVCHELKFVTIRQAARALGRLTRQGLLEKREPVGHGALTAWRLKHG